MRLAAAAWSCTVSHPVDGQETDKSGPVQDGNRHHNQFLQVGLLKGRTVDISEAGVAAMLTIEVSAGEIVELSFMLPHGPVTVCATVRQRNAFRYGFEFVVPNSVSETIRLTCRDLFVDQTLFAEVKI